MCVFCISLLLRLTCLCRNQLASHRDLTPTWTKARSSKVAPKTFAWWALHKRETGNCGKKAIKYGGFNELKAED